MSINPTGVSQLTHESGGRVYKVWMRRRARPDRREGICGGRIVRLNISCLTTGCAVCSWDGRAWTRRPGSQESRAAAREVLDLYNW